MAPFKSDLVKKRAALKCKVTILLKKTSLHAGEFNDAVTDDSIVNQIEQLLAGIEGLDSKISEQFLGDEEDECEDGSEELSDEFNQELTKQTNYHCAIKTQLAQLKTPKKDAGSPSKFESTNCDLKLPLLHCGSFNGEGGQNLEYGAFITQFNNIVGLRTSISDSTKFTYLKSYLKGYAQKVIAHLQVTDANYLVALQLLEKEFLNLDAIVDDLFTKLLSLKPKNDSSYLGTKLYINDVRCILCDLEQYKVELLTNESSAKFISHIVLSNISPTFRQELVRKVGNNYPTLDMIFEHYVEVIRTICIQTNPKEKSYANQTYSSTAYENKQPYSSTTYVNKQPFAEKKFTENKKLCKLCGNVGHSMMICRKYGDHDSRLKRCKDLKLCCLCSSTKHEQDKCPRTLEFECSICKLKEHVSALCPKFKPFRTNLNATNVNKNNLLPTYTITICNDNVQTKVRCLVDTGSQSSYIALPVLERIGLNVDKFDVQMNINTYAETTMRSLAERDLSVNLGNKRDLSLPFYIDPEFSLAFSVNGLSKAIDNLKEMYELGDIEFIENDVTDDVRMEGLLGVDILQHFDNFFLMKCRAGSAFSIDNKILPFGHVDKFMVTESEDEIFVNACSDYDNCQTINSTVVNCAFSAENEYLDPIRNSSFDDHLDENLNKMFSTESLGIVENDPSDYDKTEIEKFRENIVLENGRYYIKLPWDEEKISKVPSNFGISKSVLSRTVSDLISKGLFDAYDQVFTDQLKEGIIEELDLKKINVYNHVWIPHRAIVKTDAQTTTKVRPVLNCSLKVGKNPSINDASYPGINLLTNLLLLLISVRTNDILVVADIRKAFLQIMLSDDADKNRFTILWQHSNGELRAFRYCSLVFGLTASPFILNYLIKFHLEGYENDHVTSMLKDGFYVDNLQYTGNDVYLMENMYRESLVRMQEGGFDLRSWYSNSEVLRDKFFDDERSTQHGKSSEKILGYLYNPKSDLMFLAEVNLEPRKIYTKRTVLSDISKVYDPLGLSMPVTVMGKIFIRKLWQSKIEWDDELDNELSREWELIKSSSNLLPSIGFPRKSVDVSKNTSLVLFCDASRHSYGFAAYGSDGETSTNLIFSKVKVVPLKTKTMPTLELLAMYLAIKCIEILLMGLKCVKSIVVVSDSQVALDWVVSERVKSKANIFASNRVKDITDMRNRLLEMYHLTINFKYVPTDLNVADLLTRGLNFEQFSSKINFWKFGPKFIQNFPIEWPELANEGCFSADVKTMLSFNTTSSVEETKIFDLEKYSSLNRLLMTVALVFKFIQLLRGKFSNILSCRESAKSFLIRYVQKEHFHDEIRFLQSESKTDKIPILVNNLNLFMCENQILRSRGRLNKCNEIQYDLMNPIMLPKNSNLTHLFILDFHEKCMHLGVNTTLNRLRNSGFWVAKGRAVIKTVLSKCFICKKLNAFAFKYPKPTDFISDRVNFITPYKHTGVDYTGHFFVKNGETTSKFYLLVFTCLNIRAVHLELVPSMSTSDFLLAFIKFSNIYRSPDSLYSDNGSTFTHAARILQCSAGEDDLNDYLSKNAIKHVKIPVYAAWVGSYWERLIRVIKGCLYKSIGRKKLELFQFMSLLTEVQNAVNERPLSYRDSDVANLEILTPNSFLKIGSCSDLSFGSLEGSDLLIPNRKDLLSTLNRRDELNEKFKTIWYEDYLLSLRENSRNMFQDAWEDRVKLGDVVLLYSPVKSRVNWPLGRVTQLLTGSDGKTRCVKVMRSDKTEGTYTINHLYPLELSSLPEVKETSTETEVNVRKQRPVRNAAKRCKDILAQNQDFDDLD